MTELQVYTDGSFNQMFPYAGWAFVIVNETTGQSWHKEGITEKPATSGHVNGEFTAIEQAVKYLLLHFPDYPARIHTDFEAALNLALGIVQPKAESAKAFFHEMQCCPAVYKFCKVAGHTGIVWNDQADALAKSSVLEAMSTIKQARANLQHKRRLSMNLIKYTEAVKNLVACYGISLEAYKGKIEEDFKSGAMPRETADAIVGDLMSQSLEG